ncbi:hypothetical protein DENSPDRAFT_833328 [Dentipellis sp. KUC8613]|nr:hypothetical protein DENSPDRAFT_833328 [Dentipellis sp. KUC8613]
MQCQSLVLVAMLTACHALSIGVRDSSRMGTRSHFFKRVEPVPPAGSGTFNPGTLSHPTDILPIKQLIESEGLPMGDN